jgi:thymidylate kinase
MIAFIGVDGCGKSAVIRTLRQELANSVKATRKSYQPSRKPCGSETIWNHSYPPRGMLVSIFKLFFRAFQWCWLYYFRYTPLAFRGTIVFFDRFYFDDIQVDPLKCRYGGPMWLTRKIRAWLPGPDVYILLDAPESVIVSRKMEMTLDEIVRIRHAFLDLKCPHAHKYIVDASAPLSEVVGKVRKIIQREIIEDDHKPLGSQKSGLLRFLN